MTHYAGKGGLRRPQKEHRGPESEKTGSDGVFSWLYPLFLRRLVNTGHPDRGGRSLLLCSGETRKGEACFRCLSFSISVLHALNLYYTIFLQKFSRGSLCKSMGEAEGLFGEREGGGDLFGWALDVTRAEIFPTFPLVGSLYLFSLEEGFPVLFISR